MTSSYQLGDTIRLATVITTVSDGLPYDPPKMQINVALPDDTVITKTYPTDAEVVQTSSGHYRYDLAGQQAGGYTWVWRALDGSDNVISATEDLRLRVANSKIAL